MKRGNCRPAQHDVGLAASASTDRVNQQKEKGEGTVVPNILFSLYSLMLPPIVV